jgi:hypothetical protein
VDIFTSDGHRETKALVGANNHTSFISKHSTDKKRSLPTLDAKTNMRDAAS